MALNNAAYLLSDHRGEHERAIELAERATKLNPSSANLLDTYGTVLLAAGRSEEAVTALRKSVSLQPGVDNQFHLGQAQAAEGENTPALRSLERAMELGPDPETRKEIEALADDIRTRIRNGG